MFFNLVFYLISLLIACFCLGVYSLFFILYSLFFILYSLFFILYSLFFILYSLFLTLQDDFYGLKIIKGER
ncbi:putative membrane protein [Helicobacter pylori NQ4161]|nr:putative membrane protein [Helicobacter pylori NQ4161]